MSKILMLLDHPFPPNIRVENEIETLTKAGHEVHIACFSTNDALDYEVTGNCIIHRKTISSFRLKTSVGALKFPFYFNYWRKYVKGLITKNFFDAIHVHDLPLATIGSEMKMIYNMKFVLDLHENWPVLLELSQHTKTLLGKMLSSYKQWKKYEVQMCMAADNVIVVVEEAKNRLIRLGINQNKIQVISNTLNISQFDIFPRKKYNGKIIKLLYVGGGITYHRGLQYVIQTLKILRAKQINVLFDIVGSRRYLSSLVDMVSQENLQNFVKFHGYKKFNEITSLYESSDIAIITHLKSEHSDNTIPNKLFQYMYAGLPVITSNCDPLVRIINETHSGISYAYDNPNELANIIEHFVKHPSLLNDYIGNGRKAVLEKYNFDEDAKTLINIYKCTDLISS